jgi:hypothetical protein
MREAADMLYAILITAIVILGIRVCKTEGIVYKKDGLWVIDTDKVNKE